MDSSTISKFSGKLITIEGPDGTGKSTQIKLLCERLRASGQTVVEYDFPNKSGSPIGELIGKFLRGKFGEVAPEFLALAFSIDRFDSRERIRTDLASGHIVVCDRYVASNIAFQRAKLEEIEQQVSLESTLNWLEYDLFKLPLPKFELVLFADEQYFTDGHHRSRQLDSQRAYLGVNDADIHEDSINLQIAVNAYYSSLPNGPHLCKISIFDNFRERLTEMTLHQIIWDTLIEAR